MQLSKTDVVAAGVAILDAYGLADLTMRRLARELDVTPGALYWHFADKQALLGAVTDAVLAPLRPGSVTGGMTWRDAVAGTATRLRDALLAHGDGAELVAASAAAGQSAAMNDVLDALASIVAGGEAGGAGLRDDEARLVARTVVHYVLGFTGDEQSRMQWDAAGARIPAERQVWSADGDARFAFGMQLLLDGIAARAATTVPAD